LSKNNDVPGVIAPPPLILLFFLVVGALADLAIAPPSFLPIIEAPLRWVLGGTLIAMTILIMTFAITGFRRAGTPVPTRAPTSALVTRGAHALSRNPIYLSFFFFYLGIVLLTHSWSTLALLPVFALVMRYGVVAREEAYLENKFGDDYRAYKGRVPRWL
jgi:protein-S-isoprenylcysteine O-methyltransferase Ste14